MKRRKPKLEELIAQYKPESIAPAKEVLEHLYKAVLRTPEFTLSNGVKARLDPYYAPEVNEEGELKCGIDVLLDNGTHLEFTVKNTGWGKSFVNDHALKKGKKGSRALNLWDDQRREDRPRVEDDTSGMPHGVSSNKVPWRGGRLVVFFFGFCSAST